MINPRELRIGNWVNYEGKPVKAIGNGIIDSTYSSKFSPIELTGAVLQKVGFAKYSLSGYTEHFEYSKHIGGEVIRITALHDCDFSILLHHTARRITSLHDLQNKIFAVTGQELEVEFKEEEQ